MNIFVLVGIKCVLFYWVTDKVSLARASKTVMTFTGLINNDAPTKARIKNTYKDLSVHELRDDLLLRNGHPAKSNLKVLMERCKGTTKVSEKVFKHVSMSALPRHCVVDTWDTKMHSKRNSSLHTKTL